MNDELLDLVNENDEIIGTELRSKIYTMQAKNFRAVNVFVINSSGQLWIPRRTARKKLFPLCLDMSVAGHVKSGESYDEAFRRETDEEINLDVTTVPYKILGRLTPHEHGLSAFTTVYEIPMETTPHYNTEDFFEYFWLTPPEVLRRLDAGDISKDDLPKLLRHFYPPLH